MTLAEMLLAAENGAAAIYHMVVNTGKAVAEWESAGEVTPLVEEGAQLANALLKRMGIATNAKQDVTAPDIHTALKKIAAADPTVMSGSGMTVLHGLTETTSDEPAHDLSDPAAEPAADEHTDEPDAQAHTA